MNLIKLDQVGFTSDLHIFKTVVKQAWFLTPATE